MHASTAYFVSEIPMIVSGVASGHAGHAKHD